MTDGGVVDPDGVETEGADSGAAAHGGVARTGGVGIESPYTDGGVVEAASVTHERRMADGRIVGAGVVGGGAAAHQRIGADGGVIGRRPACRGVGVHHGLKTYRRAFYL